MPLPPYIQSFLANARVAYRAGEEPQELNIDLDLSAPDPTGTPAIRLRDLIACVNSGAAGGAHFSPESGAASLLSGPRPSMDPAEWHPGPSFRWILQVRCVSPGFLRSVVEVLSLSAHPIAPAALSIYGSLRTDGTELSVLDSGLMAWSTSTATYPQRWPSLPFTVHEDTLPRGCAIRVRFADDVDPDQVEALDDCFARWGLLSVTYPSLARDDVGFRSFVDREGVNRREASRYIEEMDIAADVATATLLNILARFSGEVAKIEHVDVRMP